MKWNVFSGTRRSSRLKLVSRFSNEPSNPLVIEEAAQKEEGEDAEISSDSTNHELRSKRKFDINKNRQQSMLKVFFAYMHIYFLI